LRLKLWLCGRQGLFLDLNFQRFVAFARPQDDLIVGNIYDYGISMTEATGKDGIGQLIFHR
jgi:hypothetical protein